MEKNMSENNKPIKRIFFGCTLTKTSSKELIKYLTNKKYDFEELCSGDIVIRNIEFEALFASKLNCLFSPMLFVILLF